MTPPPSNGKNKKGRIAKTHKSCTPGNDKKSHYCGWVFPGIRETRKKQRKKRSSPGHLFAKSNKTCHSCSWLNSCINWSREQKQRRSSTGSSKLLMEKRVGLFPVEVQRISGMDGCVRREVDIPLGRNNEAECEISLEKLGVSWTGCKGEFLRQRPRERERDVCWDGPGKIRRIKITTRNDPHRRR